MPARENFAIIEMNQKSWPTRTSFRFGPDHLEYAGRCSHVFESDFNVGYEALPGEFDYLSWQPRDVAIYGVLALLGLHNLVYLYKGYDPLATLAFHAGLVVLVLAIMSATRQWRIPRFTVLQTTAGEVRVLADSRHDAILCELAARRRKALRDLAVLDEFADPWAELKKFSFLHEEAVISDAEHEALRTSVLERNEDWDGAVPASATALRH